MNHHILLINRQQPDMGYKKYKEEDENDVTGNSFNLVMCIFNS